MSKCVKNPRPDEVSEALKQLGFRSICHHEKKHPADFLHPGRIKFRMFDSNGELVQANFRSKKQVMKSVGEIIAKSAVRTDPAQCAVKEKEGVFNMETEQAQVN